MTATGSALPSAGITTAVLLAAGRGSRLGAHTDDRPKCLVEVAGRSMLERMLDELVALGLRRLVVVTGYRDDLLRARLGAAWGPIAVEYVHNADWSRTNNIVSLALAADRLTEDFLLLESDVLLTPGLLRGLLPANAAAVSRWRAGMDGTVLDVGPEGMVRRVLLKASPDRPADLSHTQKTVNLYSFRADDFARAVRPRLEARVRAGDVQSYYEAAFADAVADGALQLRAVNFDDGQWAEVDDATDLAVAEREFARGLQLRPAPAGMVHVAGAPDAQPGLYVYRLAQDGVVQIGVAGMVSLADYCRGAIRRHEQVDRGEVRRRVRRLLTEPQQRSPVLLAYRDDAALDALMAEDAAQTPLAQAVTEQGVQHTLWRVRQPAAYAAALAAHVAAWIADGHHRFASASRAAALWRRAHPHARGDAPQEQVLAVLMPASSLRILPYHRLLCDVGPPVAREVLQRAAALGRLEEGVDPSGPRAGSLGLYVDGRWHTLHRPPAAADTADPMRALDHDWLQRCCLSPLLGMHNAVADQRVRCVPGQGGLATLAAAVDAGDAALAVAMPAATMQEVMRVADAGAVMPAKSTYFAPKLRGGLLRYRLEG